MVLRGDIAAEIEMATANNDWERKGRDIGSVIYEQDGKYFSFKPSVDVPRGQVIRSDHLNLVDVAPRPIKNARAIVVYSLHKVRSLQAMYNQYMNLSKRLNAPVYVTLMYSRTEVFIHSNINSREAINE